MAQRNPIATNFNINLLSLLGVIAITAIPIMSFVMFLQSGHSSDKVFPPSTCYELSTMGASELSNEKLRQEILKLKAERQQIDDLRQRQHLNLLTSYGSFITALVAVVGVIITIWRTSNENARQRKLDRKQLTNERDQREVESRRRLNEQFAITVKNLGAKQVSIRVSAAVSLLFFLRPESSFLYEQVYWILLANLKIEHEDEINYFLVRAFEKAIRLQLKQALKEKRPFEVSLAHAHLKQINLSNLNLSQTDLLKKTRDVPSQIDLGFADLQGANLTDTQLQRTRGIKVNLRKARLSNANLSEARLQGAVLERAILHGANLVAADLKSSNLRGVHFMQARLQSAHLHKTDLRGARFEQAYLADTYFLNLNPPPDDDVLKSILNAHDWEKAHFDQEIFSRLEALSEMS